MNRLIIIILMFLAFLGIAVYRPNAIRKPVISDWEEENDSDIEIRKSPEIVIAGEEESEEPTTTSEYKHITPIKPNELKNMKKYPYILILTGTTCPHCQKYKPALEEVLAEHNLTAYEIDMWVLEDSDIKVVNSYLDPEKPVEGVPTTVIIDSGDMEIDRRVGGISREEIEGLLQTNGFID